MASIRFMSTMIHPLRRCLPMMALIACFMSAVCAAPRTVAATSLEREVLVELSLARTSPSVYAQFLKEFRATFQGDAYRRPGGRPMILTSEGVRAVDEAIRFLQRQKPLPPLEWSSGLAEAAAELAEEQGESGDTGHVGRDGGDLRQRVERYGRWQGMIGENISYGPDDARGVVISLIVDDGVAGRGHRKNIFSPAFKRAGAACGPHPAFRAVCVIDFAGGFKE
jgi:uncharacterized protein YkwD